ncbi:unnamed protein product, partial [Lampetra planeri]
CTPTRCSASSRPCRKTSHSPRWCRWLRGVWVSTETCCCRDTAEEEEPIRGGWSHVTEDEVLDVLEGVLQSNLSTSITRGYALTASMKLSTRFSSTNRIRKVVSIYGSSIDMELAASVRSNTPHSSTSSTTCGEGGRGEACGRAGRAGERGGRASGAGGPRPNGPTDANGETNGDAEAGERKKADPSAVASSVAPPSSSSSEEEEEEEEVTSSTSSDSTSPAPPQCPRCRDPPPAFLLDSLGSITSESPFNNALHRGGGVGGGMIPAMVAFEKGGLRVEFAFERGGAPPGGGLTTISLRATNSSDADMADFVFQAAVPKTFQLQLLSPSSSTVPAHGAGTVTQLMRVLNPNKHQLRMRIKLSYTHRGATVTDIGEVNNFPPQTYQ